MTVCPVLIAVPPTTAAKTAQSVEQQRSCAKRALSRCAALSEAPSEGWRKDAADRPLPNNGFHWSVSHKPHWAGAVVADRLVGIDIEHTVPRREALLDELATDSEWELVGDRSWHSFFRLWTAKESVLKANGRGIGGFPSCRLVTVSDLHYMTLHYEGDVWRVEHYYLSDHVAAVACNDVDVVWHVTEENVETSKRQNVEMSKRQNVEASNLPN